MNRDELIYLCKRDALLKVEGVLANAEQAEKAFRLATHDPGATAAALDALNRIGYPATCIGIFDSEQTNLPPTIDDLERHNVYTDRDNHPTGFEFGLERFELDKNTYMLTLADEGFYLFLLFTKGA